MSLRLEINGVDFTAYWRVYESRWTMRAWNGESFVSEFLLDDPGTFIHANLSARKIVEVWEDASGSDVCLYRGRVSNKHLGMSGVQNQNDMRWTVEAEDANIELRGIRVNNAVRPIETDEVRVEAIRVAFLNGAASSHPEARDSTDMGNTYIGDGLAVNLEAETYTDTDPLGVLNRIVEVSGRTFFVTLNDDGTMELYYGNHTSEDYVATDIELTDAGVADGAVDAAGTPSVDVYAVYKGPNAGEHAGQNVLTGGALRWGDGNLYEDSDIAGAEAVYDKWEETFTNEFVQHTTQADNILNKLVGLSDEDFTYLASIDMRADQVHRLRNGMMVLLKRYRANKPVQGYVRIAQIQYEPLWPDEDGEAWYRVSMDLGRAQGRRLIPRGRHQPGPHPPAQPDPDTCTRFYLSSASPGISPSTSALWDVDSYGPSDSLTTAPDSSFTSSSKSTTSSGGVGVDVRLFEGSIAINGATAVILAAGGAHVRMQARAGSRHGIGINESNQDNISQLVIRVFDSGGSLRGTAYAGHSLSSSAGSTKWYAGTPIVNRVFPPAAASDVLTAVPGTVTGDYMVVEAGLRSFYGGVTGGSIGLTSNGSADLPQDELTTDATLNAWLEICTVGGGGGSSTEPIGGSGDGAPGTSNVYAPIDHVHEHGLLAEDEIHYHDDTQIEGAEDFAEVVRTDSDTPGATDDEDDGYRAGDIWVDRTANEAYLLTDATAGAAVWEQFIPAAASTPALDDLTDVTISSPADGEVLTYDSGTSEWVNAAATGGGGGGGGVALSSARYIRTSGDYTLTGGTSSTVWSNVDGTNLSLTITTGARRVAIGFVGSALVNNAAGGIDLDVTIDGTRQGGATGGIMNMQVSTASETSNMSFTYLTAALSAGSHTFNLQWLQANSAHTATLRGSDPYLEFYVQEIADTAGGTASFVSIAKWGTD